MLTVNMFKMTHTTYHFNENQKVWVQGLSGAQAARVTGKFRGRGRYVSTWVHWGTKSKPTPEFKAFTVTEEFAYSHNLEIGAFNFANKPSIIEGNSI